VLEEGLGRPVFDGAEAVEAAEVVHAVHPSNPTAIVVWRFELSTVASVLRVQPIA
jgi:hypothetical protein